MEASKMKTSTAQKAITAYLNRVPVPQYITCKAPKSGGRTIGYTFNAFEIGQHANTA